MTLLCEGKRDKDICKQTGLSTSVVRKIVHCLCGKLDASNRVAAAVNYVRLTRGSEEDG